MTDSLIQCWRLKRDVGFWRPSQAIRDAALTATAATTPGRHLDAAGPEPAVLRLRERARLPDRPAVEVIRQTLGETTPARADLVQPADPDLPDAEAPREDDAFNARIWAGLHFRTAMVDAYRIGHITARRVIDQME